MLYFTFAYKQTIFPSIKHTVLTLVPDQEIVLLFCVGQTKVTQLRKNINHERVKKFYGQNIFSKCVCPQTLGAGCGMVTARPILPAVFLQFNV